MLWAAALQKDSSFLDECASNNLSQALSTLSTRSSLFVCIVFAVAFHGVRAVADACRRARVHWQAVSNGLEDLRGGLACFGRCRKGSIAIKVALMVAAPMILIDAAVNIGRWLHEGSQVVEASDSTVPCQQMKDEYRVAQTDCRRVAD
ncbi:MAG: hypothetical protein ACERIG_01010 [Hyphomicrobium sp.]